MTAAEIKAFQDGLALDKKPKDGQDLARELMRQKRLTRFQAEAVYRGDAQSVVVGEYVVLEQIGAGGMGKVFKAEHRRMGRIVALKLLAANAAGVPDVVQRFEREARAAGRLEHPNIVAAYDAGEADGNLFLAMQYVEGADLRTQVKKEGPLPVGKALDYLEQVCHGLAYAHGEGVIHRDIKPSNLLLDKKGTVKILDMGLARFEEKATPRKPTGGRLTLQGQILGTVDYMSPEQADDTRKADARSDIYSLGCTLHYLLIGKPPFPGDNATYVLLAHQDGPIPSLAEQLEEVPAKLESIFQKMLAKKPEDRFQSMSELLAALASCRSRAGAASQASHVGGGSTVTVALVPDSRGSTVSEILGPSATEKTTAFQKGDTNPSVIREKTAVDKPKTGVIVAAVVLIALSAGAAIAWMLGSLQ